MRKPAIDIVTTLREPLPLTLAFVAHHLAVGVCGMHLYFDDPDDPAIGIVSSLSQVRVTACTPRYWARHGGRPAMIVSRQTANTQDAQGHARSKWLLHCDADEFLINLPHVLRILGSIDDDTAVVRLPVWERCLGPDDDPPGLFGGLCRSLVLAPATVYGDLAPRLTRGMASYAGCKSITRVSAGLSIGIHDSARSGPAPPGTRPVRRMTLNKPQIVHVDGLTPAHAALKMISRGEEIPPSRRPGIMSAARSAQIAALTRGGADPHTLFTTLRGLTREMCDALLRLDAVMPMPIDAAAAAIRRWPQTQILFRADVFDRLLADQFPAGWRRSA